MTGPPGTHDGVTAYEFTVAGALGPALRAAFAGHHVATLEPCTVIRLQNVSDSDLVEVVRLLESARLSVREVHRLADPQGAADLAEDPAHPIGMRRAATGRG